MPSGLFCIAAAGAPDKMSFVNPFDRPLPSVALMVAAPSHPCSRLMSPWAALSLDAAIWNSTHVAGNCVPRWTRPLKVVGRLTKSEPLASTWTVGSGWSKFAPAVPLPFQKLL